MRFHPRYLSRSQKLASMLSPTDSICSGGGDDDTNDGCDGEGDLDLLRDEDGKSDGSGEDDDVKSDDNDGISDGSSG
ncbi:hypothetical protein Tco_1269972 [Tanacetum coccineum]